jgi:phosphoglycolate phosphatase
MARIVFDLDGTLIDSAPDLHVIANDILAGEGLEPVTLAQVRTFIGSGTPVFIERLRATRGIPGTQQGRLHEAMLARYEDAVSLTRPYPNVRETLTALRASGHRLGVCTNKPVGPTRAVLAHLELEPFFGAVFGGDSLAARKPDPAPLFAAFEALGEGEALYVGDSEIDAETARRAGLPFLLFTEGYRQRPVADLAHTIAFSDFAELPALVARMVHAAA